MLAVYAASSQPHSSTNQLTDPSCRLYIGMLVREINHGTFVSTRFHDTPNVNRCLIKQPTTLLRTKVQGKMNYYFPYCLGQDGVE